MITSVSIENLRGIREGCLDGLAPLTVLVGPNGSGKSTVLDALLIGGGRSPAACAGFAVERRSDLRHGARWLLAGGNEEAQATIRVKGDDGKERTCVIGWRHEAFHAGLRAELVQKGLPGPYSSLVLQIKDGALNPVPSFVVLAANNTPAALPEALPAMFAPVWMVDQHLAQLSDATLWSRILEGGRRREVRDLIAEVVPGLEELALLSDYEDLRLGLLFADRGIPVALAGDGVKVLVHTCLELAKQAEGTVLMEEPEVHQHIAAIRQSARAIVAAVRRGIQVVLTTHSLELLDALLDTLTTNELDKLVLYRLKLDGGRLLQSRFQGPLVQLARGDIGEDLR